VGVDQSTGFFGVIRGEVAERNWEENGNSVPLVGESLGGELKDRNGRASLVIDARTVSTGKKLEEGRVRRGYSRNRKIGKH